MRTDTGKFGGDELHAATLESEALKGIGSRKTVGFRPAAPPTRHNSKSWKKLKRFGNKNPGCAGGDNSSLPQARPFRLALESTGGQDRRPRSLPLLWPSYAHSPGAS